MYRRDLERLGTIRKPERFDELDRFGRRAARPREVSESKLQQRVVTKCVGEGATRPEQRRITRNAAVQKRARPFKMRGALEGRLRKMRLRASETSPQPIGDRRCELAVVEHAQRGDNGAGRGRFVAVIVRRLSQLEQQVGALERIGCVPGEFAQRGEALRVSRLGEAAREGFACERRVAGGCER